MFIVRSLLWQTLAVSSWPRVPGCVSVVHMRAVLSPDGSQVTPHLPLVVPSIVISGSEIVRLVWRPLSLFM